MKTSYNTPGFRKWPISIEDLISADASAGSFDDDWVVQNPNLEDF